LGEDACMFEDDDNSETVISEIAENTDDIGNNADFCVDEIAKEFEEGEDVMLNAGHGNEKPQVVCSAEANLKQYGCSVGHSVEEQIIDSSNVQVTNKATVDKCGISTDTHAPKSVQMASIVNVDTLQGRRNTMEASKNCDGLGTHRKRRVRSASCSVEDSHSLRSGLWSIDWLHNVQRGDIGLISSNKKRLKKILKGCKGSGGVNKITTSKKKAGGMLRHPVPTLKKVARLPSKDREEVMKVLKDSKVMNVLKQKICNRCRRRERVTKSLEEVHQISSNDSSSAAPVTNDWTNWVVLKGSEEAKKDDINDTGKTIGVSFNGTTHNKFVALPRSKKVEEGPVLTPVVDEGGEVSRDV